MKDQVGCFGNFIGPVVKFTAILRYCYEINFKSNIQIHNVHCTASFSRFLIHLWLFPGLYMFVANTGIK